MLSTRQTCWLETIHACLPPSSLPVESRIAEGTSCTSRCAALDNFWWFATYGAFSLLRYGCYSPCETVDTYNAGSTARRTPLRDRVALVYVRNDSYPRCGFFVAFRLHCFQLSLLFPFLCGTDGSGDNQSPYPPMPIRLCSVIGEGPIIVPSP